MPLQRHAVRRRRKAEGSPKTCHDQVRLVELGGKLLLRRTSMSFLTFFFAGLLSAGLSGGIDEPSVDTLQVAVVTADKGVVVSRADTLLSAGSFTVSEVLQKSPSLHVGDNGGLAGLKTVSLRGMGSAHTAVYIDGVRVGNVQSGQNDLGMLDAGAYESAVVDYAQNSVSFNTARPKFGTSPVAGNVRFSAGSFGTYMPSARLDFRLSERVSLSANASGAFSKGNFSYGDGLVRENNDLSQVRAGLDLFGRVAGGEYHVKAYYNDAERGTPGSVDWPSDDRQKDMNAFVQGTLRKNFSTLYTLRLSSKASYDDIFYTSSWGDSRYGQTELQLNSAHDFQIRKWWKLSLAADVQWDGLESSNYSASRFTALTALASSFRTDRFAADVALEYAGAFDRGAKDRSAVSPSVGLRYAVAQGLEITAFGRRAYRVPTFNELYYVGYGNPDLKPEDAWMTGIGADFERQLADSWTVNAKVDGFYNMLADKITSAPSEADPNIWMPYNIGKVQSAGVDVVAGIEHAGEWRYSFNVKWSYQSALDMTPGSYSYGTQIPYIARNTVIVDGSIAWKGWNFIPLWQFRGGRSDGTGELPDWNTLDVTVAKSVDLGSIGTLVLKLSVRNALDNRYEMVSGYPMPGRSITGGLELRF